MFGFDLVHLCQSVADRCSCWAATTSNVPADETYDETPDHCPSTDRNAYEPLIPAAAAAATAISDLHEQMMQLIDSQALASSSKQTLPQRLAAEYEVASSIPQPPVGRQLTLF